MENMFSKLSSALQHAVEAFQPNQPLMSDYVYHWKAITQYFVDCKDEKRPVESTNIPSHLKQMLAILIEEEAECGAETGPCMEYMLHHKILETLHTLARADCPPGMRQVVLQFFTNLLGKIQQPLLPHISVHRPVHRLMKVCGEVRAAPSENEEIQFLCMVCGKLKENPYLVNFFLEAPKTSQALLATSHSPDSSPSNTATVTASKNTITNPEFGLVNALLSLFQSPDGRISVKACEGLLLLTSLPESVAATILVDHTAFIRTVTDSLITLFKAMPTSMDPSDIECVEAKWGLDVNVDSEDSSPFEGKRSLISFLSWFDYIDQLINIAHENVGSALSAEIHLLFLKPVLQPLLVTTSEVDALSATVLLTRCLRHCCSVTLTKELVKFLLGTETAPEIQPSTTHRLRCLLIERCDHMSDELSTASLKLFEELLKKPCEHIMNSLVLRNLANRAYLDRSLSARSNRDVDGGESDSDESDLLSNTSLSDSDVEEQRIRAGGHHHHHHSSQSGSQLSADDKKSLEDVVNCFMGMLPDELRTSYHMGEVGYETYLSDAYRHFREISVQCLLYEWPTYVRPFEKCSDVQFFEGSFLKVLFDRLSRILDQPYAVNLQVTSVLSQIASYPHPHIHEYFLNPYISLKPGSRSLTTTLRKIVNDLVVRSQRIPVFKPGLLVMRERLTGIRDDDIEMQHECVLYGAIVMEEFCKELAAIAYVKETATSSSAS